MYKPQAPIYDEDIIVYTMGKVGTTTVMNTVKSAGIPINRAVQSTIHQFDHPNKRIVTMMRDPVAWAISYYLEMPAALPDKILEPENFGTVENFSKNVTPFYALKWFNPYFREIIGTNIYGCRHFIKSQGYHIYGRNRVLFILTHRLSDSLIPALCILTGRPESDFTFHQSPSGAERFGEKYVYLHNRVRYERLWYIDNIIKTRYIKMFFTLEEQKAMIEKWTI